MVAMSARRLVLFVSLFAIVLAACSGSTPSAAPGTATAPTSPAAVTGAAAATQVPPAGATAATSATAAGPAAAPFARTACASGVNLSGQTISFYNLTNHAAEVIEPT